MKDGRAEALCTAPIHKGLMAKAGFAYAGHTDYLRDSFGGYRPGLAIASGVTLLGCAILFAGGRLAMRLPSGEVSAKNR